MGGHGDASVQGSCWVMDWLTSALDKEMRDDGLSEGEGKMRSK